MMLHSSGSPVFMSLPIPLNPIAISVQEANQGKEPVKEQVGSSVDWLNQLNNSLFSNAMSFCGSEESLSLVDHKV